MKNHHTLRLQGLFGILLVLLLAVLAACSSSSSNSNSSGATTKPQAQPVQITLSDTKITSSVMSFTAGKPYRFMVTNTGKQPHDFIIISTAMKSMNMKGMAVSSIAPMGLTSTTYLKPGETRTLDYAFSGAGMQPEFLSYSQEHDKAGMKLDVMAMGK